SGGRAGARAVADSGDCAGCHPRRRFRRGFPRIQLRGQGHGRRLSGLTLSWLRLTDGAPEDNAIVRSCPELSTADRITTPTAGAARPAVDEHRTTRPWIA